MNKNIINTLPTTTKPDFSGTLDLASAVKNILPVIDSSSNILESVTRIVESKNNRDVSIASIYSQADNASLQMKINGKVKLECLKNCNEQFHAILNSSLSEKEKKDLLSAIINEENKCL
jgi:hypothetical protein